MAGATKTADAEEAESMRDRIISVAGAVFYRDGFAGTSMNLIASELGISAPALYWHFKSKQELCFISMKAELDYFVSALQPTSAAETAPKQLSAFVSTYVLLKLRQSESLTGSGAAGVYAQLRGALDEEQRQQLDELQRQVVRQVRAIVELGVENGDFKVEDVNTTSFAIISLCEYVFVWFDHDGPLSAAEVASRYCQLVLAMVGSQPTEEISADK